MKNLNHMTVSVVIELDNAAFNGGAMWAKNVNTLLKWMGDSAEVNVVEVFITHNQSYSIPVGSYMEQLPVEWVGRVRPLSMEKENAHYYMMKNGAANQARGETVVFLDCDLKPKHGSFKDMVEPVYREGQVASCGYVFFPTKNFISKSYSLFWYFCLYYHLKTIGKNQLYANNCVFNKDWFLKTGFEVQHGGFKVCCFLLGERLKKEGYTIQHPDVWFQHELWNPSISFFIWRALVGGRDHDKKFAISNSKSSLSRLNAAGKGLIQDIKRVYKRHIKFRQTVQLTRAAAILSFIFSVCFFSLLRASQAKSALSALNNNPEVVPRNFIT